MLQKRHDPEPPRQSGHLTVSRRPGPCTANINALKKHKTGERGKREKDREESTLPYVLIDLPREFRAQSYKELICPQQSGQLN